jgi:hypothetical protein
MFAEQGAIGDTVANDVTTRSTMAPIEDSGLNHGNL